MVAKYPPLPKPFSYLDTTKRSNLSSLRAAYEPKVRVCLGQPNAWDRNTELALQLSQPQLELQKGRVTAATAKAVNGCKSKNAPPEAADMVPPITASPAPRALPLCLSRTISFPTSRQPGEPRSSSQPATVEPNFTYNEAVLRKIHS